MTIKNQFRFFLAGVILIPLLTLVALPIYQYQARPEKVFAAEKKTLNEFYNNKYSLQDLKIIDEKIKELPPFIQFMVIGTNGEILISTVPEFPKQSDTSRLTVSDFIKATSDKYMYQFSRQTSPESDSSLLLITRTIKRNFRKHTDFEKIIAFLLIAICFFELICIPYVINLSRTISRSITVLDNNTKKLAGGELDIELEYGKSRKNANEITSLTENLEKLRLTLKSDSERRSRFIMGISHDLRTPVAVIKGYTEAMSDGTFTNPEETKEGLKIIAQKTDQLETMINTLISFVKLNLSEWIHQLKKQPLKPLITEFMESSASLGNIFKRNVNCKIDIDEDAQACFDEEMIKRVLENLISNAFRYTKDNDSIEISAVQEADSVLLSIADTGEGIDENDLNKIFDLFYKASGSRQESGMGIGLSVVKTIITSHGWKIDVESEKNHGTKFTITIPQEKCGV